MVVLMGCWVTTPSFTGKKKTVPGAVGDFPFRVTTSFEESGLKLIRENVP